MQNKGAIKLFAILLGLACLFYISFTWKTRSVESEAAAFGQSKAAAPSVLSAAKEYAKGDENKQKAYLDSIAGAQTDYYLDSVRNKNVYNLFLTEYTYEECKQKEINLGLDLRGGMNVTLEISVAEIISGLSNNPNDANLTRALSETQKNLGVNNNKDFVTLFAETFERVAPGAKLAPLFQSQENKGKVEYSSSNEQVIAFIRDRVQEGVDNSEKTFRSRIDRFGVSQPNIQKLGNTGRVLIELPGVKDKARVRALLQGTANLEFWETYENGEVGNILAGTVNQKIKAIIAGKDKVDTSAVGTDSTATAVALTDSSQGKPAVDSSTLSLKEKLNKSNGAKTKNDSAILAYRKENPLYGLGSPLLPAVYQTKDGKGFQFLPGSRVGSCKIRDTAEVNKWLGDSRIKRLLPSRLKLMWSNKTTTKTSDTLELYAIKVTESNGKAAMYGDIIADARVETDPQSGGVTINMSMTGNAAEKWKNLTQKNSPKGNEPGRCIAIVMDNMVYSAPTVNGVIPNGSSVITGNFDFREAEAIVAVLSAGKLPARARIVEETVVGPTLGAESIGAGMTSFVIAFFVILAFMAMYYNKAGWVANLALFVNVFFIMGILISLTATLTLPGIAGIVLTIGLSVDANILIFERIREELALGKVLPQAIKEGFKHAMSSIIDSNVTLLILGIILYAFGSGPVQGFATTLIVGILSSLFAAVLLSRVIFDALLKRKKEITFDNNFTRNAFKNVAFDFVKRRKLYYAISAVTIVLGVVFYFKNNGFNLGVDFKGGRTYMVRFNKDMNTEEVKNALHTAFGGAVEVKTAGVPSQLKITTSYRIAENEEGVDKQVEDKLKEGITLVNPSFEIVSQQKVGPTIATDIVYGAYGAVLFSCLMMFIYIVVRFKKWQYGLGAVVALFHDVLVVLSFYTIFDGILPFSLEIGQDFIAAILTVMGYTMTETVVVFDRIRERLSETGKSDVYGEERNKLINFALNSTLSRTILTSLTVFFVLLVIFIFGGDSIRGFTFALLVGRIIGTYSSLCISTPIVVDFDKRDGNNAATIESNKKVAVTA